MLSHSLKALAFVILASSTLVKGQPTWRGVVGSFGPDEGTCVRTTAEGNAVVVGATGSFGNGSADAYMIMLDGTGDLMWSRVYGGAQVDRATALCIDSDGSLVVAGYTNGGGHGGYDGWVFKTDPQGELLWERFYGGSGWDFFEDITPGNNGGWLLAGSTASEGAGAGDGWLLGIGPDGAHLFSEVFGGLGDDEFKSVTRTVDGGVVAAGSRELGAGDRDAWIVKLLSDNSLQWEQLIGGSGAESGQDVLETQDGGYSVVGTTESVSAFVQQLHFKLNSDGDSLWSHIGGGQVNDQEAMDHVQLSSGRFAITGYTKTSGGGGKDLYMQLSAEDGGFVVGHTFGLTEDDIGNSITTIEDGFFVCGSFGSTPLVGAGNKDVFIIRADSVVDTATEVMTDAFDPTNIISFSKRELIPVSPNPATTFTQLHGAGPWSMVHLTDAQGRMVRRWERPVAGHLDLQGLEPGRYELVTFGEDGRQHAALIIAQH